MLGSLVTSSRRMGGPIGFAGLVAGLVLVLAEVAFGSHAAAHSSPPMASLLPCPPQVLVIESF